MAVARRRCRPSARWDPTAPRVRGASPCLYPVHSASPGAAAKSAQAAAALAAASSACWPASQASRSPMLCGPLCPLSTSATTAAPSALRPRGLRPPPLRPVAPRWPSSPPPSAASTAWRWPLAPGPARRPPRASSAGSDSGPRCPGAPRERACSLLQSAQRPTRSKPAHARRPWSCRHADARWTHRRCTRPRRSGGRPPRRGWAMLPTPPAAPGATSGGRRSAPRRTAARGGAGSPGAGCAWPPSSRCTCTAAAWRCRRSSAPPGRRSAAGSGCAGTSAPRASRTTR
mmetsp:Transcript_59807/g.171559  ORF Transcript_59807/g.171559 Transcript_59807/m.171559 type:complete len:287 (+) Transcript_59807:2258-3118(+)